VSRVKDNILQHYADICKIVDGDVSAEVIATDFAGMIEEAKVLADIADNIVVKIPMIKDGVKALSWCRDNGIPTNCTLVFSGAQALSWQRRLAQLMCRPFIGRIDDTNWDGMTLISEIAEIYAIQGL
jgi:transaldolase